MLSPSRHARGRCAATLVGALLAAVAVYGCGGEAPAPYEPITDAGKTLYWDLTLDHRSILLSTVAPYDTIRLTATPRNGEGEPLTGLGPVRFLSTDGQRVQVSDDGLVRVRSVIAGSPVLVIAELTAGGLYHADTAYVMATADPDPPVLTTLDLAPLPPDSTRMPHAGRLSSIVINEIGGIQGSGGFKLVMARALDQNGDPVPGAYVHTESSDTSIAIAGTLSGTMYGVIHFKPGVVRVAGSLTAYGVKLVDTVDYQITLPVWAVVRYVTRPPGLTTPARQVFESADVRIAPGGTVVWVNATGRPTDVVFDDPTNVVESVAPENCASGGVTDPGGSGNIPAFGAPADGDNKLDQENCRSRRFPVPGVYRYRSTVTGATGRIVVTDEIPTS